MVRQPIIKGILGVGARLSAIDNGMRMEKAVLESVADYRLTPPPTTERATCPLDIATSLPGAATTIQAA